MTYGYTSKDGEIYRRARGLGEEFGPKFGPGDVIGCGIVDGKCFYTKNGTFLGTALRNIPQKLYPAVDVYNGYGVQETDGSTVDVNFGKEPFKFDLDWEKVRTLCK